MLLICNIVIYCYRFRGPPPLGPGMNFDGPASDKSPPVTMPGSERQAIIKDHDLKEFDRLAPTETVGSWAAAGDADIDYSTKLVFSDEDEGHSPNSSKHSNKYVG